MIRFIQILTAGAALGLLIWIGSYVVVYGSISDGLKVFRGEEDVAVEFQKAKPSEADAETIELRYRIRNLSRDRLSLVGATPTCNCLPMRELPVTIEPGGEYELAVVLKLPEDAKQHKETLTLYTDSPSRPEIPVEVEYVR